MGVILIRPRNKLVPREIVSTQYPISLGYLAAYLKQNNVKVDLLDCEVQDLADDSLGNFIKERNPILIGMSCVTSNIIAGHDLAKIIKARFPDIKIIVGGVHATALPQRTLQEFPCFDFIAKGEGELTLLELHNALVCNGDLSGVRGLLFRNGSGFVDTGARPLIENLDSLPFPDRELLDMALYKKTHASRGFSRTVKNIAEVITARGCPFNCIFCAVNVNFNRRVRYRSVENIIAEMDECIKKHQTNHFSIMDDTFAFRKDLFYPICDYLKSKKVTWDCYMRVNLVGEDILKKAVDSGCEKVSFGIESGSERILKLINKQTTIQQIKEAFALCRKTGLRYIDATFMLGNHPLETTEDIKLTMNLIMELNPDFMAFFITVPFPGTELNRIMKEGNYLIQENWNDFILYGGKPSWSYQYFDGDDLLKLQAGLMKRFYLRPSYILKQLIKIKTPGELIYWARLGYSMVKRI
ncbi:MAG: cobalamin B12-binding domain-containing protein [Candidatus Nealsonbacteria bacterium]|nr:cobalamin B12-binding domain-containing protein [Candidatus Nealsonbacteria bacterium]